MFSLITFKLLSKKKKNKNFNWFPNSQFCVILKNFKDLLDLEWKLMYNRTLNFIFVSYTHQLFKTSNRLYI